MKSKRKIISILVLALMLMVLVSKPGQADEEAASPEMTLTMQQAVDLAVQNNTNVKLAEIDRDKKTKTYSNAQRTSNKLEDNKLTSEYSNKMTVYLDPKITERQAQQAEQVYQITINQIKINAESAFYELLKAEENQQIAENALQRAEEQLQIAKSKYSVGTLAKIEVIQNEAAQAAANAALCTAQSNTRQKMLELNQIIGVDMKTIVNPTGVFEFNVEDYDYQTLLDNAGKESMSIIEAQNNYDIATWTYDFEVSYYGPNYADAQLAKKDIDSTAVLLQQAKDNIVTQVNQTYANYKSLEEQYQYRQKAVEMYKETYRLQQLNYEVGKNTYEDVQKASDNLKQAEADLSECIYSYNTIKSSLKYNIYS
jgi:outer membrane protein TolC